MGWRRSVLLYWQPCRLQRNDRRRPRLPPKHRTPSAFTVAELLIVIASILVLTGLILATSGYVQKKGARSRAEAEIAAISAALENYRSDNGIYPIDTAN